MDQHQPARKNKKTTFRILIGLLFLLIAAGASYAVHHQLAQPSDHLNTLAAEVVYNNLNINLQQPDILIDSQSLSQLPRDLLTVPMLRDTLTEDFVFYYQNNGDRLGLEGTLRRIIYEHDLQLRDKLLDLLLDGPAKVALWRDEKGRLSHYMLVIQRGKIASLLQPLLFAVTSDSQLKKTELSELTVAGAKVPLYQLRYNGNKSLLFASHGDNLLVLSSSAMMFKNEKQDSLSTEIAEKLLASDQVWNDQVGLSAEGGHPPAAAGVKQRIIASAHYLGFGYQRLVPALSGIRFDMDATGWQSFIALADEQASSDSDFDLRPLWQAMPSGASFCAALPHSRGIAEEMLNTLITQPEQRQQLSGQFAGHAAICWYAESHLYSPLIVTQMKNTTEENSKVLGEVFSQVVGAHERFVAEGVLPVEATRQGSAQRWQREVSSRYGNYNAAQSTSAGGEMPGNFFRVSLASQQHVVLFSLDDKLVARGLQALDKTFPPMSDVIPQDKMVPLFLSPEKLAILLRREVSDTLPQNVEPVFFNAAQTALLPKLASLEKHRDVVLTLPEKVTPGAAWQWIPLHWQEL